MVHIKKTRVAPAPIILVESAKNDSSLSPQSIGSPGLLSSSSLGLTKKESDLRSQGNPGSRTATIEHFEGGSDNDDQLLKVADLEDSRMGKISRRSLIFAKTQLNILRSHRESLRSRNSKIGLEEI